MHMEIKTKQKQQQQQITHNITTITWDKNFKMKNKISNKKKIL